MAWATISSSCARSPRSPPVDCYLDLPADVGLERKRRKRQETADQQNRGALSPLQLPAELPRPAADPRAAVVEWNRLDAREVEYHRRVADGYQRLIAQEPERWRSFDARQPIEVLAEQIGQALEPWLEHIQMIAESS